MEATFGNVGLVFAQLQCFPEGIVEALLHSGAHATFVCAPEILVSQANAWRQVVVEGNELANGALIGVTLDGRIENWPPMALASELDEVDRLLAELGQDAVQTCYLPSGTHVDGEGDYRAFLESRYAICFCDAEDRIRIGKHFASVISLQSAGVASGPSVVSVKGNPDDLGQLRRFVAETNVVTLGALYIASEDWLEPKI